VTVAYDPKTNMQQYRVYSTITKAGRHACERKIDRKAFVVRVGDLEPDLRGNIRSPLSAIVSEHLYYLRLLEAAMLIEGQNTKQRYVADIPATAAATSGTTASLTFIDTFGGMDPDAPGAQFARTFTSAPRDNTAAIAEVRDGTGMGGVVPVPEGVQLPHGRHFAGTLTPPVRDQKFLEKQERYANHVCGIYGVPRATLGITEKTDHGTAFADINSDTLRITITGLTEKLSSLLTKIYTVIYQDEELASARQRVLAQVHPEEELSEDDIYRRTADAARVTVSIPFVPSTSAEMLNQAYGIGIIDWPAFYVNSMRILGLPINKIPPEPTAPPKIFRGEDAIVVDGIAIGGKPKPAAGAGSGAKAGGKSKSKSKSGSGSKSKAKAKGKK